MARNTSSAYKTQIQGDREFCTKIIINYLDGTTDTLTDLSNFMSIKFEDACSGTSDFAIGSAIINETVITLNNRSGAFTGKEFYGASIIAYAGIYVNGSQELLKMGRYLVDESVSPGITIAITAYDNMILFDKSYTAGITYPATLAQIALDLCDQCDVTLASSSFPQNDFIVDTAPSGVTCREVLSAIAQIAGCFARCNADGQVEIRWYSDDVDFTISTLRSKSIGTDDVVITGINIYSGSDIIAESGADGYRLSIKDNVLLTEDTAAEAAEYLATQLVGLTFRPLKITCLSDMSIEAGDKIQVTDETGTTYTTLVTSNTFTMMGAQSIACNAASPAVNSTQRLSEAAQAVITSQKYTDELAEKEETARETAVKELTEKLDTASGMYQTEEKQEDGSTIIYLHDKLLLEDSQNVIKITSEAIGVSNDGGETWPYGFTLTGELIAKLLYVVGINADYINSGTIVAKDSDGNTVFSVNVETGEIIMDAASITMGDDNTLEDYITESIQDSASQTQQTLTDQTTALIKNSESIILAALANYVTTNDYDEYKETISSQLTLLADQLEIKFTTATELINDANSELTEQLTEYSKYFRFTDDGLEIGADENALKLTLDNDMIKFTKNDVVVGYWDGTDFHTGNIVVDVNERAQFGNFAFIPRSDGSLMFLKIK